MIRHQWKAIVTNKKLLIPILAILFIPIMYAGMFLWAFWDPYAQLNELPVAVVNEDEGASYEGQQLALGDDLLTNLEERQDFQFASYSREEAEHALDQKDVYMVIEIPERFSQDATTLLTDSPTHMELIYRPNEAYNFLSSQIGETAVARIQATVNEQVTQTFTEGLFDAIDSLKDGITKAADGSATLEDGATQLQQGTTDLRDYLASLAEGSVTLTSGTEKLAQGVQSAYTGSQQLTTKLLDAKAGAATASEGANAIASGATTLQQGVQAYTDGVNQLFSGASDLQQGHSQVAQGLAQATTSATQLSTGLSDLSGGADQLAGSWEQLVHTIAASLPEEQASALLAQAQPLLEATHGYSEKMNQAASGGQQLVQGLEQLTSGEQALAEGSARLATGITELSSKNEQLNTGMATVAGGSAQLAQKLPALADGLAQLQQGSSQLTSGLAQAASGASELTSGSHTLSSSSQQLASGAEELTAGSEKLVAGTTELHDGLADGAEKSSAFQATEDSAKAVAQPVQVEKAALHEVPNYGTGFSPYFISLGLFVGALLTSIVFPLRDPASQPTSGSRWYASKTSVVVVIGILQAAIVSILAITIVGVEPVNTGLFVGATLLTSLTFMALVQLLVTVLGDAGRFVAIVLLIMQLTTSAGTFPLELLPKPLQLFNQWLPMTYTVDLFKSAISIEGGTGSGFASLVLASCTVGLSLLTWTYFVVSFRKQAHA